MYEKKSQEESLGTDAVVGSLKSSKHNENVGSKASWQGTHSNCYSFNLWRPRPHRLSWQTSEGLGEKDAIQKQLIVLLRTSSNNKYTLVAFI